MTQQDKKSQLPLLLLVMFGLGAFVYWDRFGGEPSPSTPVNEVPTVEGASKSTLSVSTDNLKQGDDTEAVRVDVNALASLNLKDFSQTLERPLFQPSRRAIKKIKKAPPPKPKKSEPKKTVAVVKQELPPPKFRLVGVLSGGPRSIAVLRSPNVARTMRLEVGDIIGGWEIETISARSITLKEGERTITLRLFRGR